jgi:hypothetical protein
VKGIILNHINQDQTFMNITITSTTKIVHFNGIPTRIWEGHTDTGIPVHCFITRITAVVEADEKQYEVEKQFNAELLQCEPPSVDVSHYPLYLIL